VQAAREANMPRDTMERAIKRGAGGEADANYEEVRYEGYGPGGVAVIVEALTDNRNRTASDVRTAFTKSGGSMGETNSVSFMFDRVGAIHYPASAGSSDAIFEAALEAGADNVESGEEDHDITCAPEALGALRDALEIKFGPPDSARLDWRPQTSTPVSDEDTAKVLFKLIETLDDLDDVQRVASNFEIPDEIMAKLGG
jgi:YebC/PmpR family DNA-binding regulatory protein